MTNVNFASLLELKSMPALKTLICFDSFGDHREDTENLKQQLPHLSINKAWYFNIAKPFNEPMNIMTGFDNTDWIWEIRAKKQNLFAKVIDDIDDSNDSDDSDDSDDSIDSYESNDSDD